MPEGFGTMELLDLEKHCDSQRVNDSCVKTADGATIDLQTKTKIDAAFNNKVIGHQPLSQKSSWEMSVLPSVSVSSRPSMLSRSPSDDYRPDFLKKRRATRLGSKLEDPLKEDNEPVTPGACLERYVERASVPGLAYLYTSRTRFARLAWCAMLLFTLVMLTLHLFYLIDTYLSWPKHTKVTLGFDALEFPAVTFCNVNPARMSQIHLASKELQELTEKIDPQALTGQMIQLNLQDLSHFAKNEIQGQAEGTEFEEIVDVSFNKLNRLFGGNDNSPNINENKKERRKDEDRAGSNLGDEAETIPKPLSLESSTATIVGIGENGTSNISSITEKTTMATTSTTEERSSTRPKPLGNRLLDIFRGKRSVSKKKKVKRALGSVPSVPIEIPRDVGSVDVNEASIAIPPAQDQEMPQDDTNKIETNNPGVETTQAPTSAADSLDLNNTDKPTVENNSSGDSGRACSRALQVFHNGTNGTELANNATSQSDLSNSTFCNMETSTRVSSHEQEEKTEEPQPMNFINGLDIVGTNLRREAEMDVFSDMAAQFTERSAMANIRNQFTHLFNNESRSTRIELGHRIQDMLVDCSFQGGRCHHT
ncbi:amiloride-sensitive sodium channel subunit beta [Elysia marginata]|uniref:Amiloride-sensitive sodium channel subunit beta n=1 Tax=Elysia marginata TaxID=1093978 RepID=A0AAV4IYV9_9GAST|nr:amiloride-sensitive sodium channel subunit beta [Elysia marginata]